MLLEPVKLMGETLHNELQGIEKMEAVTFAQKIVQMQVNFLNGGQGVLLSFKQILPDYCRNIW